MMQCTDIHDRYLFRLITKQSVLYTEMVTTGAIIHGNCMDQLNFNNEIEHPISVQLGGSDPKDLATCARICESLGYDEINLNVGCPSERVQKGSFGACLMQEPSLVAECISAMQESSTTPITIKCRIGINEQDNYDFLPNFTDKAVDKKIQTLIVHARVAILSGLTPRQNRKIPPLKYENVYELKKSFPDLEIVINGGINTLTEAKDHLNIVDGVMLGRAAYDNPMMTADVDSMLFNQPREILTRENILRTYLKYCVGQKEYGHAYSKTLKHVFGINKGQPNAKNFRRLILEIMQQDNLDEKIEELVAIV